MTSSPSNGADALHSADTEEGPPALQTYAEEIANSITHGLGFSLSLAGAIFLMATAIHGGVTSRIVGCAVYSVTLVALYAASTLSHVYHYHPRLRLRFRALDQACIYLLIVGTYTPLAFEYLYERRFWWLTITMWTLAIIGFLTKTVLSHRVDSVVIFVYILLGWMPILVVRSILQIAPHDSLWMVVYGGICYSIGAVFLTQDHRVTFFHSIWHLLVIAGSAFHYFAILWFVAAGPPMR